MRAAAWLLLVTGCGRAAFAPRADAPADYAAVVLADGPLAYYRLDESALGDVLDASGHGQHAIHGIDPGIAGLGTIELGVAGAVDDPNPGTRVFGLGNFGMPQQDGSVAQIDTRVTTLAPWAGDFTIEGWLRPQPPPEFWKANFFCVEDYIAGDPASSGFRTGWDRDLAPVFWATQAAGETEVTGTQTMTAGVWSHLVFVRAGSRVTVYLDGVDVGSDTRPFKTPAPHADRGFGAKHGMPSVGDFDELAIYGTALSPERITAHLEAGRR